MGGWVWVGGLEGEWYVEETGRTTNRPPTHTPNPLTYSNAFEPPPSPLPSYPTHPPTHPNTVLVGLYEEPERPSHAVDYIKRYIGAPSNVDVEGMKVGGWVGGWMEKG